MTIDQRLHHAARELHEIPLDSPPLPGLSAGHARRSMIPAVAASLLMVLGGITVWGGLSNVPVSQSDTDTPSTLAVSPTAGESAGESAEESDAESDAATDTPIIGAREEVALIGALADDNSIRFLQPPVGAV